MTYRHAPCIKDRHLSMVDHWLTPILTGIYNFDESRDPGYLELILSHANAVIFVIDCLDIESSVPLLRETLRKLSSSCRNIPIVVANNRYDLTPAAATTLTGTTTNNTNNATHIITQLISSSSLISSYSKTPRSSTTMSLMYDFNCEYVGESTLNPALAFEEKSRSDLHASATRIRLDRKEKGEHGSVMDPSFSSDGACS
ncbi:hypothetical protein Pelo_17891 [Pelomyxa schiedti]|nr:hypothetical protein Pelo_17891 [Pelomyxa schiedti]